MNPEIRQDESRSIRVAYHLDSDAFGGVERYLITLLEHLDRRRFEPILLGRVPDVVSQALGRLDVEMVGTPEVTSKWNVRSWQKSIGVVRQIQPVVFHGMQSHSFSGQYALASALLARTPRVLVTAHLPTPAQNRRQAWLAAVLRRGVDVQIVPGEWAQRELTRLGQRARRTVIVPNAIDTPDFVPREKAREMLGVASDAIVVGGLMRLEAYKRPDLVVELAKTIPGVTVVLFGDGPEHARLVAQSDGENVVLPGFRADASTLIRAFDVFVHPCPYENQPLAILEAMAAGLPVVVANEGGSAWMVEHDRTGLLASATLDGMSNAVRRLLEDRALADQISRAATLHVTREADPTTMARRVEALYEISAGQP
jgi:glycosyltransferase involved in cell wall biosynthesis